MPSISDVVRKLRASGLCLIPSGRGEEGKSPDLDKWKPYQKKPPKEATFNVWLLEKKPPLWGTITGKISKVVVVDCDGNEAIAIMGDLLPHVRTPSGGCHYYFEYPGHSVKTTVRILPKIDIRADGGFANLIGTNPMTGGEYQIEIMPTPENIYPWEQMPNAILDAMGGSEPEGTRAKSEPITTQIYEGEGRNTACTRESGRLLPIYKDPKIVKRMVWAYNQAVCVPPLSEEECASTWEKSLDKWAERDKAEKGTFEAPEIISAEELSRAHFPEINYALPGMIPEGFTILAGKPKSGKSWWALQAAYSVALGKNQLDGSECVKGRALFLGLEDGLRRLQFRISRYDDSKIQWSKKESGGLLIKGEFHDIPEGLDLAVNWPRIGDGGIEELEKYLDAHPDTRLIVIDIIKRITKKKGKGAAYDEDYDSVRPLQELATRRRVAILGVHHTRKALAEDPLEMVSGTFGLTGGADSIIVVQRMAENESKFSFSGRDIDMRELAMRFDSEVYLWFCMGDADIYFVSEEREEILNCLIDGGSMSPKEIADSIGKNRATVRVLLSRMLRDGIVMKNSKGKYSVRRAE